MRTSTARTLVVVGLLAWIGVAPPSRSSACEESAGNDPSRRLLPFSEWLDECPEGVGIKATAEDGTVVVFTKREMRELVDGDDEARAEIERAYATTYRVIYEKKHPGEPTIEQETERTGEARQPFLSPIGAAFCGLFTLGFSLFMSRAVCSYPGATDPDTCRDVTDTGTDLFTNACIFPW